MKISIAAFLQKLREMNNRFDAVKRKHGFLAV